MTTELQTKSKYFLSIDGLRLIASINIILFHMEYVGGFTNMGGSPGWFFALIKGPYFHATIFFLLGGFIFSSKFYSVSDTFKTWPFILKRLKELYPLHCITTLSMLVLEIIRQNISGTLNLPKLVYSTILHLTFLWPLFPFNSCSLNTPSWALGAFFFCYIFFGFILKFIKSLSTTTHIVWGLIGCFSILAAWNVFFVLLGAPTELYQFFHIFPPIRAFEFIAGMLLARIFQFHTTVKINRFSSHIITDFLLLLLAFSLFAVVKKQVVAGPSFTFFSYHFILPLFFVCILFLTALQKGIFAHILAIPIIRNIGRSSFYPYLLHIPLLSWISFLSEYYFQYYKLLHNPVNVWIFVFLLYAGSYAYSHHIKKRFKLKKVSATIQPAPTITLP